MEITVRRLWGVLARNDEAVHTAFACIVDFILCSSIS